MTTMASMPSSAPQNPRPSRPRPRNFQLTISTSHDQPPSTSTADLNRPLPPPPATAAAELYDIPSLRRKPVPDDSPDSRAGKLNHSRSFSHPFPSIFGSKKADKRPKQGSPFEGTRDARHDAFSNKQSAVENSLPRDDRQPMTGRCMTCDSTVRWPHGLKVFRCTTCLTINDLEHYSEKGHDAPGSTSGPMPQRKTVPLSIERTRSLLDRCLRQYLESRLEQDASPTPARAIPVESHTSADDSFLLRGTPPEGILYGQILDEQDTPPPPSGPRMAPRSPSEESTLSTRRPSRNGGIPFIQNHSIDPFSSAASKPTRPHDSRGVRLLETSPNTILNDGPKCDIFHLVENYITGCFVGCATLNHSFLTPRTPQDTKPRSNSGTNQRRQMSEPPTTPNFDKNVFLSELDAKTLLLGDVAENGSWWLGAQGGRASASGRDSNHQRDTSPDKTRSSANTRYPRINWLELAEWYRILIYAGDLWEQRWQELQSKLSGPRAQQCWRSIPLENLQRDIIESRIHLQRSLLKVTENLLKRPRQPLRTPEDCRFLLILLANPLLSPARLEAGKMFGVIMPHPPIPSGKILHADNRMRDSPLKRIPSSGRRPGSLGLHSGIIKRILGLIANLSNENHQYLVSWFSRYTDGHFQRTVEMVGSFVTYRLSRQQSKPIHEAINPTEGLVPSFSESGMHHASQVHAALGGRLSSISAGKSAEKPRLAVYGEDWQVRVAARVMALLFQANVGHIARKRDASAAHEQRLHSPSLNAKYRAYSHGQIVPISNFYNTMLDYADLVSDFETWESTKTKFTFCQYPFFLSIYAKIHILEHDARRQMEVKAREAFFDSILSRKAVSQYLILKVRRDCLVEDSLRGFLRLLVLEVVISRKAFVSISKAKKGLMLVVFAKSGSCCS